MNQKSGSVVGDIIAIFTLTVSSIAFPISLAVLIFSGALDSGMPRAIGSFVVGGGLMAVLVAARSQIVPVAMFVQDGPALLVAAVASDFVATEGAEVADVFVLMAVTMVATAVVACLIGHFGLGRLVRYVPMSVVAAFLGGTGWLVLKAGFEVMTNTTIRIGDLRGLFTGAEAGLWVPGLMIGLVGWWAGRSPRVPPYVLGVIIIGCLAGFYVVVAAVSSVAAVEAGGWLLGPFPETRGVGLVTPDEFRHADWPGIARATPGIAGVVGLACLAQLLNLTGIGVELAPRLNVDRELRTSAGANLAVALLGVSPGFQGLGYTVLLNRLGASGRAVPVISGGLVVVFGIVGVAGAGYVPRLIIGALLIMTGITLLDGWIRGLMRSRGAAEKLLGLTIVGVVGWVGLLQGVGVGIVAACGIFIVRYSQVDPLRAATDSRQLRSRVDRSPEAAARLMAAGDQLLVLELQGFLFFGSLMTLEDRVRQLASGPDAAKYLVFDFANVTGIDSSGHAVIERLFREFRAAGIVASAAGLDPTLRDPLLRAAPELATHVPFFPSMDAALGYAEGQLLASMPVQLL